MKKTLLIRAALACTILILTAIFWGSCKSAPVTDNFENTVSKQKPETTYVNTAPDSEGKIYTVCVFTEITEVTAIEINNHENKINSIIAIVLTCTPLSVFILSIKLLIRFTHSILIIFKISIFFNIIIHLFLPI